MNEGIPKDVDDHTLEDRGGIAESERHDSVFEKALSAMERCFPFVSLFDADELVIVLEVDLVEVFRASNSLQEFIHIGEGVTIGNSDLVDCSIVNA